MFDDETFNAVLCLGGSLCHILDSSRRDKAASELVRAAKIFSLVCLVISRLELLKSILAGFPMRFLTSPLNELKE